jgi:hypothetical protein
MAKEDPNSLVELRKALSSGASTRSPLFQYMLRNHDQLREMFDEARPNWAKVTEVLSGLGYSSGDGNPLQPESVRKLWYRVRKRHASAQARTKPKVVEAQPAVVEITEQQAIRPRFQPARPRHMATGEPLAPPKPSAAPERPTAEQIAEQDRKLRAQLEARAGKMPEPIFEGKKDGRQETGNRDR